MILFWCVPEKTNGRQDGREEAEGKEKDVGEGGDESGVMGGKGRTKTE